MYEDICMVRLFNHGEIISRIKIIFYVARENSWIRVALYGTR